MAFGGSKKLDVKKSIVVIGSGIGGMASGALFARRGHPVTVLEMNPSQTGGHARSLVNQGLRCSVGPQYCWSFEEGMVADRFLQKLGIKEDNPWLLMDRDGFERMVVGEINGGRREVLVPMGLERFCEVMVEEFPGERENLKCLFDEMKVLYKSYKGLLVDKNPGIFEIFYRLLKAPHSLRRTLFLTVEQWFDKFEISPAARRILYGHGGIFAEEESCMSLIAYIYATGLYHEGARYPGNGFHGLFGSLQRVIQDSGGRVLLGKKVTQIETLSHKATAVVCADGSRYNCDLVLSDISPRLTDQCLPEALRGTYHYEPSNSLLGIHIGVRGYRKIFIETLRGRNIWWSKNELEEVSYGEDVNVTESPEMLYIGSPSANGYGNDDPASEDGNLIIFIPGNYEKEKAIAEQEEAEENAAKQVLADQVIDIIDRNFYPGMKRHILFADVVSTIDVERQTDSENGNCYAKRMNARSLAQGLKIDVFRADHSDKVDNLYNVSAYAHSAGIASGIEGSVKLYEKLTRDQV